MGMYVVWVFFLVVGLNSVFVIGESHMRFRLRQTNNPSKEMVVIAITYIRGFPFYYWTKSPQCVFHKVIDIFEPFVIKWQAVGEADLTEAWLQQGVMPS